MINWQVYTFGTTYLSPPVWFGKSMKQLKGKSFLINCFAEQSNNWLGFSDKLDAPKRRKCQPDQTEER